MQIFPPQLDIDPGKGFEETDLFKREAFGKSFANLVTRSNDSLVIALDAAWGEGKTTFIKQWQGLLASKQYGVKSIYFDAFASDFHHDPLVALVSEVYGFIAQQAKEEKGEEGVWKNRQKKFLDGAKKWVKVAGGVGLRVGIRAASAGLCSLNDIEGGIQDATGQATEAAVDAVAQESLMVLEKQLDGFLTCHQEYKAGLKGLRDTLTVLAKEMAGEEEKRTPLVFIIDELDRCRPDFALDILEKIKHIFSVPGLVFVLVFNGRQVEEHVRCRYGNKIDAAKYIQKFVNMSVTFPKKTILNGSFEHEDEVRKYVEYLMEKMEFPAGRLHRDAMNVFSGYVQIFELTLRDIERIMSYLAIWHATADDNRTNCPAIVIGLCMMRVCDPELFNLVASGRSCWPEVREFFRFDKIPPEFTSVQEEEFKWFEIQWKVLVAHDRDLTDDEKQMVPSGLAFARLGRKGIVRDQAMPLLYFLPGADVG